MKLFKIIYETHVKYLLAIDWEDAAVIIKKNPLLHHPYKPIAMELVSEKIYGALWDSVLTDGTGQIASRWGGYDPNCKCPKPKPPPPKEGE